MNHTQPDTLTLVLLGTIATLSLVQGLMLLGAALMAFRAVRRTEVVAGRLGAAVQPAVEELSRAASDAAEMSERVLGQARRIDDVVTTTLEQVERAQRAVERLMPAAGRMAAAASAFSLLRSSVRAVRRFRR